MTRIITYLVVLFCLARIGDCNLVVSPPPASAASSTSSATTSSAGDNVASSAAPLIIDASLAEFNRREAREKVIAVIEQEWAKKQAERKEAGTDKEAVHRRKALHRRAEIENGRDFISERIERNKELLKEYRKLVYGTSWRGLGNRVYYGIWNAMHETKHAVTNVVGKFRGRTTTEKQDGHSIEAIPIDQAEGVPLELLRDAGAELVRPRQQQQPPLMHTEPPNGKLHARAPKTTKKGFKRTTKKGKKKVTTTKKKQQAGKTTPKKVATTSAKVPFQTPLLLGKPIYLFQSVAGNPIGCDSISCKIVTNRNLATQFQRYCWGAARSTCATGTYLAANDRNGGNCLTRSTTGALILTGCPPQVVFARKARGNIYGRDLDAVEKLGERLERRAMARVVVKDQLFAFREDNKIQIMSNNMCIATPGGVLKEIACASAPAFTEPEVLPNPTTTTTVKTTTTTTTVKTTTTTTLKATVPTATSTFSVSIFPLPPAPVDLEPPKVNYNVPVPTKLKISADEFVATLTWEEGFGGYGDNNPIPQSWDPDRFDRFGITGFVIRWGEQGTTGINAYTPYAAVQLQPLDPAKTYFAYVRSLMSDGTPSDKSVTVTFTSASARVNNLRSTMTGFFTDFNTGPGAFVERDLNTAYSQCNVPDMSASFINQQVHAHNLISSPSDRCDRGLTVIRPRATFDFTGRTGTVVFDLDGAFHRQAWYLDLLPDRGVPIDLNGHIHNEDSGGSPINVLRFRQQDQRLQLFFFGPDGEPNKIVETGWGDNDFPQMDRIGNGFAIVRNVRRPFVVKISRTFFAAFIDGIPVLNASISLPYSKAQVQFNTYSYNLQDQDMFQVVHWDNFGFDGPNGRSAVVNNYKATILNSTHLDHDEAIFQVPILDSIAGAKAARLHFTVHTWEDTPIGNNDFVLVNNVATFLTPPVEGSLPQDKIFDYTGGYAMVVSIALADLARSLNPVTIRFIVQAHMFIGNVHIEVDFPSGSSPPYTPAPMWYGKTLSGPSYHPASKYKIGLESYIYKIGNMDIWGDSRQLLLGNDNNVSTTAGAPVSYGADLLILGEVFSESEYGAFGKSHPIKEIRLLANGVAVRTWTFTTNWITFYGVTTSINTASFGPQVQGGRAVELFLVAYNTDGTPSRPSYVGGSEFGSYYPAKILVL